ncbi:MAG: hypothetical protein KBT34_03155 [Prevotella sp.]|nr:hypothetical protein [Candidatus Prevotella equi]
MKPHKRHIHIRSRPKTIRYLSEDGFSFCVPTERNGEGTKENTVTLDHRSLFVNVK